MIKFIWLSIFLVSIACISSVLMINNQNQDSHLPLHTLENTPDIFMVNANYYRFDENGLLHSHITTPKVTHYAANNTSTFETPHLLVYSEKRVPWHISALKGKTEEGSRWIYLWGKVKLHHYPQVDNPETTITTPSLTVFPHQNFAKTDQLVKITRPNTIMTGRGLTADFKKNIFTFLSDSQGFYETNTKTSSFKHTLHKHA